MYHTVPFMPEISFDLPKEQYVQQSAQAYAVAYGARKDHPLVWLAAACAWEFHFCQSLNPELNQAAKLTFEQSLQYQKQCWRQLNDCLKRLEQARRQEALEQRLLKKNAPLTEPLPSEVTPSAALTTDEPAKSVTRSKPRAKIPRSELERFESMGIHLLDYIKPIKPTDWRARTKDCAFQAMGKLLAPDNELNELVEG